MFPYHGETALRVLFVATAYLLFHPCPFGMGRPSTSAMPAASVTATLKVEMPFATAETIPAEVVKINRDEASGDAVVILKCSYMNTDLAAARKEPLRIDLQSYAGVLVNEKAIHFADVTVTDTDTDGNVTEHVEQNVKGVYIKSGSRVRFVQVFSDATIDGYAVCKLNLSSSEKEQLVTSRTIQLYDEVIVEGTDLYDGKML